MKSYPLAERPATAYIDSLHRERRRRKEVQVPKMAEQKSTGQAGTVLIENHTHCSCSYAES